MNLTLAEAVEQYVRPGQTVALEGFGHLVPMAAAHEIVRQRITGLTVARMSCDLMIDEMLAAGCISRLISSFLANGSGGSLHELRRRVESSDSPEIDGLEIEEYSHGGMQARYRAGAAKLPFYPIKSYAGSDLMALNPRIRTVVDPYGTGEINVVPPLRPDVSIVHAQRADRRGNIQAWGILGIQQEVAFAAENVIVTVEEIVDDDIVRSDPNRTIIPAQVVSAVVACPGGAFPSSVQGYYDRGDTYFREWSSQARTPGWVESWIERHVYATRDHEQFLQLLGPPADPVRMGPRWSQPVNYGLGPGTAGPDERTVVPE